MFRAHLMETGRAAERVIRVQELKDCTKLFIVNSVRKWQEVVLTSSFADSASDTVAE